MYILNNYHIYLNDKIEVKIITGESLNNYMFKKTVNIFSFNFVILADILKHIIWYLKNRKLMDSINDFKSKCKLADTILFSNLPIDAVYYSYWASSDALTLAILKYKLSSSLTVSRLHAFDIYEDGDNKGYIPWRKFIYGKIDHLVTISKHGLAYLNLKYNFTSNKTKNYYLGIDQENKSLNNFDLTNKMTVVSCGWVGKRKNIGGIFTALKYEKNIEWFHFGDGEDFDNLKQLINNISNFNLKVNIVGKSNNRDILKFYSDFPISCFLSLSTNEGLPVSMMEAMAFGIPIVSTNVGGCSEIVNENTGVLLPDNYTDQDVIDAIKLCAEKFSSYEARKRIQDECKEKFDAKKNYDKFIDFLIEENNKFHKKRKNEEL